MAGERTLRVKVVGDAASAEKSFGKVAAGMAGLVAGAAAMAASLTGALNLEKGADKLAAQLGLTAGQSEEAGKVAGSLYANAYGGSMDEVNSAVGAVMASAEQLGVSGAAAVEGVTATALDFSSAFGVDAADSVQMASQLITNGLAKDSTEAFDLMTTSWQKLPVAMRDEMPDLMNEYGVNFAALGFSGEDAMGMIVDAGSKGSIGMDKFGDAMKEFGIRGSDLSKASGAAYESIGMDSEAMANKLLAGGDTAAGATADIAEGLLKITDPAKRAEASIALFGTPLEDLGVNGIPDFLGTLANGGEGLGDFAGSAAAMGETLNDNLGTKIDGIVRKLKTGLFDTINKYVIPPLLSAAGTIEANIIPAFAKVGAALDSARPSVDALAGKLQPFADWISANGTVVFAAFGAMILAVVVPPLVAWGIAAAAAAVAQLAALAPILLVAAAIGLLVGALVYAWKNFEGFRNIVMGVVSYLQANALPILRAFVAWVIDGFGKIVSWVKENWPLIQTAIMNVVNFVVTMVRTKLAIMQMIWRTVGAQIINIVKAAFGMVKGIIEGVITVIGGVIKMVAALFAGDWKALWEGFKQTVSGVIKVVSSIIGGLKTIVVNALVAAKNFVVAVGGTFLNSLVNGFRSGVASVNTWISSVKGKVSTALTNAKNYINGVASAFLTPLVNGFRNGVASVASFIGGVKGKVESGIGAAKSYIANVSSSILNPLVSGVKSGVQSVGQWFTSLPGAARSAVQGLGSAVSNAASGVFDGLKSAFRNAINFIIGKWNGLSFTLPSFSFMGVSTPSATLSTPNLPMLATGGTVFQRGMAIVGEAGPELVDLNQGARVTPLTGNGGTSITVQVQSNANPYEIANEVAWAIRTGRVA